MAHAYKLCIDHSLNLLTFKVPLADQRMLLATFQNGNASTAEKIIRDHLILQRRFDRIRFDYQITVDRDK
jgi:hypothetical protein